MGLFRHKYLANGTLSRYKARLVVNGSTQLEGINVCETFSLVVKPGTIRTVLSLATSRHCLIYLIDVKNAFLHGDLSETRKYATEIFVRAGMVNCNSSRTSVDIESKLGDDGDSVSDPMLYRSLAEAEYCGVAIAVAETCWLRNILRELHTPFSSAMLVYCDNVSVVYLSYNPVQHQRTKHIEIDIHFVRDLVIAD
nr:ribonuclease H-like domain-containing protein [Tanacetum cinerariifolium]